MGSGKICFRNCAQQTVKTVQCSTEKQQREMTEPTSSPQALISLKSQQQEKRQKTASFLGAEENKNDSTLNPCK